MLKYSLKIYLKKNKINYVYYYDRESNFDASNFLVDFTASMYYKIMHLMYIQAIFYCILKSAFTPIISHI